MTNSIDVSRPLYSIDIPAKHAEIRLVKSPETWLFGSRGSMKTTIAIVLFILECVEDMPRHTGVIVVPNYEHFSLNTKTPLFLGLKRMGVIEGHHFTYGEKPVDGWDKALDHTDKDDYTHTLCFPNGTRYIVVSLARLGAANAISAQSGVFDEVKLMKKEKLDEVLPIFRGHDKEFSYTSNLYAKFFATDKLADPAEIAWMLNKRKQVDHQKVKDVMAVQLMVNQLKAQLAIVGKTKAVAIKQHVFRLETILKNKRTGMVYVQEINCFDVRSLLGEVWFQAAKAAVKTKRIWDVAYENKDPDRPAETFYPAIKEDVHEYDTQGTEDIDFSKPFIISVDYQHSVAPIPVDQISTLPGNNYESKNTIDYIYTLFPETLKDAVQKFCDTYKFSIRTVYYCYDHTAIGKRANADSYDTIVRDTLVANGWTVEDVYIGQAPEHFDKYNNTDGWLKEEDPDTLPIRIHKRRCANLLTSIKNAGTKTMNGQTKKDKKFENTTNYPDIDQSVTTHACDAWDMTNEAVLGQKLIKPIRMGGGLGFR
ncbi:hypothetical protein ACTJIJ_19815 [Niabella sp. 22666]|uniref:hypothetical protein n=1 Tax=Niabella sp. 22666 TaxID=3453954 RepID=UPI003F861323